MDVTLHDKYHRRDGTVFLTGMEGIVRLLLEKQRGDADAGGPVNQTYISGYEGSPLGGLDMKVVEELELLNQLGRTVHQFGINEKTAASAMLGTQFAESGDVDAFWYGKAHGTMWIPDEVWLANLSGTGANGAMVLLCGEDHRSKSSVSPGSSDWVLRSSMVPVFYPANIEEVIRLGLHAIALSRYTGVVTSLKLVTPVCDGASTVELERVKDAIELPVLPDGTAYRKRFNNIVMATGALPMQRELVERKWRLVTEYVRLNRLNRIIDGDAAGDVSIVATGKSAVDLRQALAAMRVRVPVLHLAVSYPLDEEIVRSFAAGRRRVYVVEEPGPFVEEGVRGALLGSGVEGVWGKADESGERFIPAHSEVDPEQLARLLWPKLRELAPTTVAGARIPDMATVESVLTRDYGSVPAVTPMSCGGCPYNSFRDLAEKPGGAIGCSSIRAIDAYDNGVLYIPTMGAGGAIYSGWAQFNGNRHIYQYLGDGSYFHSGRGAIQSCVQGGVNITFLLLFNGVVALTGGQNPGGQRSIAEVAQELRGLGVAQIGVVTVDPRALTNSGAGDLLVYGLDRHAEALQQFKDLPGTTVLILDKECATERSRRRRRQGLSPDSYVMINQDVCEGCGDCYAQSEGCAALYNEPTELGEKTQVRQGNCTQDELCIDGECPSFMVVEPAAGTRLRRRQPPQALAELPEPERPSLASDYTIYAMGRGGTGVVTISHLLAYAAMMDGAYVHLSNNTGLAQKGGPVEAPMTFSTAAQPTFNRIFPGSADLYLAFDLLRAAEGGNLNHAHPDRTTAVVSTSKVPTAGINRHADETFPASAGLQAEIDRYTDKARNLYLDSYWLAEQLFGDVLFANMILLGAAYQAGLIPVSAAAIERAIELNGKANDDNVQAFRWGRLAVVEPGRVEAELGSPEQPDRQVIEATRAGLQGDGMALDLHDRTLADLALDAATSRQFSFRFGQLREYQDTAYARRYCALVEKVRQREQALRDRGLPMTRAVVRALYHLMAYKDEYEVARLLTNPAALERVEASFSGRVKVRYKLHPPSLRWTGIGKLGFGPGWRPVLKVLYRLRWLRGRWFDPFGRTECRRIERELIDWYGDIIDTVIASVSDDNHCLAAKVLEMPLQIKGYEQVKTRSADQVRKELRRQLEQLGG